MRNPRPSAFVAWNLAMVALVCIPAASLARPETSSVARSAWRGRYERVLDGARMRTRTLLVRELALRPLPASWAEAWTVESENYAVRLTRSRAVGLRLARDLDTMLDHFQELLGSNLRPGQRFPIHIHPDLDSYNVFGNGPGAEHSSFYGSWFAPGVGGGAVVTYFDPNPTRLRMWMTHGALHQYLTATFQSTAPTWIEEGLASYFSLFWSPSYGSDELERLRSSRGAGGLFPLRTLLDAQVSEYTDRAQDRLMQLGMFFNYLLHYRPDTRSESVERAPFAEYLSLALQGEALEDHPVHELLNERLDELEADFNATSFAR